MLISDSHRFIFIHVCHTGGTSIKEALKDYATEPEKFKIRRPVRQLGDKPNPFYQMWKSIIYHASARDIKRELPAEMYGRYYKFAFVRNPWDRLVSSYQHLLKDEWSRHHRVVKSMDSFDEFVDWSAIHNNYSQKSFVTDDDGELIVDFVGRYENLMADFDFLCKTLGINSSLSRLNSTVRRDYRTYYSERSKKLVEKLFQEDIEFFGYSFTK